MNVRRGFAAVGLVLLLVDRRASAEESHAFRVAYDAPPGCPSAENFSAAIQSSSAKARSAATGEPAIELLAFVTHQDGGFLGVLRIRRPDGTETTRAVPALTCGEAASAMTLIAAIAVDPDAAIAVASARDDGSAAAETKAEEPKVEVKPATPATAPVDPAEDRAPDRETRLPVHEHSWWFGTSGSAGIVGAMAPQLTPDFGIGATAGTTRKSLVTPWIRLSGHFAESAASQTPEGTAHFERLAARLTGCPIAVRVALYLSPLVLRPCLLFEAGRLEASGSNTPHQKDVPITWSALGATVRGEFLLVGPLSLGMELGALLPMTHDKFYFDPKQETVYQVGYLGFLGSLELGVRIL
jgi:hypothetical protein